MDKSIVKTSVDKKRRALRVRKSLRGSQQKPRMCVVKTNKHIFVQLINDDAGHTIASMSTLAKEFRNSEYCKKNKGSAKLLGEKIAEKAKTLGIEAVIFDRGPFKYHGILAELAQAARDGGLQF